MLRARRIVLAVVAFAICAPWLRAQTAAGKASPQQRSLCVEPVADPWQKLPFRQFAGGEDELRAICSGVLRLNANDYEARYALAQLQTFRVPDTELLSGYMAVRDGARGSNRDLAAAAAYQAALIFLGQQNAADCLSQLGFVDTLGVKRTELVFPRVRCLLLARRFQDAADTLRDLSTFRFAPPDSDAVATLIQDVNEELVTLRDTARVRGLLRKWEQFAASAPRRRTRANSAAARGDFIPWLTASEFAVAVGDTTTAVRASAAALSALYHSNTTFQAGRRSLWSAGIVKHGDAWFWVSRTWAYRGAALLLTGDASGAAAAFARAKSYSFTALDNDERLRPAYEIAMAQAGDQAPAREPWPERPAVRSAR